MAVQLLNTTKGRLGLVVDDYQLRLYRRNTAGITWVCVDEKKKKCKGRVKTTEQYEILSKTDHTCVCDVARIEVKQKMENCRKRVREEVSVPVHKIFREEMAELYTKGYDLVTETKSYESVKTTLCADRRKVLGTSVKKIDTKDYEEPSTSSSTSNSKIVIPILPKPTKRKVLTEEDELDTSKQQPRLKCRHFSANQDIESLFLTWALDYTKLEPDQQLFVKKGMNDLLFEGMQGNLHRHSLSINEPNNTWPSSMCATQLKGETY